MGGRAQSDVQRGAIVDELRRLLAEHEGERPAPPQFPPHDGEPEPWSNPPPGGFDALRSALMSGGLGTRRRRQGSAIDAVDRSAERTDGEAYGS